MTTSQTKIGAFAGEYHFLSNMHLAEFDWDGLHWFTSEAAYQAAKSLDRSIREQFSKIISGHECKRLGKTIDLRPDWSDIKRDVMYEIVRQKFTQNQPLADALLATGDAYLEEGNWWGDKYWGVSSDVGSNHLGKILMSVRAELGGGPLAEFELN
jgi:ribA/ribD-fused uncharacterized protein